jgi:hypothetical protein
MAERREIKWRSPLGLIDLHISSFPHISTLSRPSLSLSTLSLLTFNTTVTFECWLTLCVCVWVCMCVCVCVCVCVCEWVSECVYERERECVCVCVCVSVWWCGSVFEGKKWSDEKATRGTKPSIYMMVITQLSYANNNEDHDGVDDKDNSDDNRQKYYSFSLCFTFLISSLSNAFADPL